MMSTQAASVATRNPRDNREDDHPHPCHDDDDDDDDDDDIDDDDNVA